jgi:ABC-2 type transport system permease protein
MAVWARIFNIARKELLQFRRDRRLLPMAIFAPMFQLVIYGYAISTTIANIDTAVYDLDRTQESRELIRTITSSNYFRLRYMVTDFRSIDDLIDRGDVTVAVIIPTDFAKNLSRGTATQVQVIVDGSDPSTATTALGYMQAIFRRYSENIIIKRLGRMPPTGVDARIRVWYNPTLESKNYMVPGIIAFVLMQITMTLTAFSIVREKERGTIEQLIVTPIRKHELILGKVLPYVAIGYLDIFLILLVGTKVFGVPVTGSVVLLLLLSGLFLLSTLGIGLFISTVSRNQQQAMMAISFIMMPSFLLSGFFFPIANMPAVIQLITYLIPLRYYLVIVRGVFLKGTGISLLWEQIIPLTIVGIIILSLSVVRFRKKLE